ncbi:hypothetical protein PAAG_04018, partial [Paracoccidioides lutzii Pb01]
LLTDEEIQCISTISHRRCQASERSEDPGDLSLCNLPLISLSLVIEEFYNSIMDLSMGREDSSADLRAQLAAATSTPVMDTTQPSNSTPLHPKQKCLKEKLTPLETFDGTDLVQYPAWRLNAMAKLRVNGRDIGSLDDQACLSFATILPTFDQKILEAKGQFWDDEIKIGML